MTTTRPTFRAQDFITVPAGAKVTRCNGPNCGALIYFVRSPHGRPTPVDCDVEGGKRPSETKDKDQGDIFGGVAPVYDGRGVSHFLNCPDANLFSGRGRQ